MINIIVLNAKLPLNLWDAAILNACHIHNRIPFRKMHVSPCEIRKEGKKQI